jgi:tRNA pseudouridine13 synthase
LRLKCRPQDFVVKEQLDFVPSAAGGHYVHVLHKEKLSTPEALSMVVQHGQVERDSIAYAGLKDRQAITDQHISIAGRSVDINLPNLRVTCIGRTDKPINSKQSRGNAFTIVVRDLLPTQAAQLRRNLPSLGKTGFPNYFDDQRFGSLKHGQGFPMLHVLRGNYEEALRRLIATPSPRAITGDVKLKQTLAYRWGDWAGCLQVARGPIYQPLFSLLRDRPNDFRGALELLPLRQRIIHSFAFQSFLWNRALSNMLRGGVGSAQRLRIVTLAGDLIGWKYLAADREAKLLAMSTPLYGPEGSGGSQPFRRAMLEELELSGLEREDFLRDPVPGMAWKEEPRDALVKPGELAPAILQADDEHEGRVAATLSFTLPRGAYATMLLKRLFAHMWYTGEERETWRSRRAPNRFDREPPAGAGPRRSGPPRGARPPVPFEADDDDD